MPSSKILPVLCGPKNSRYCFISDEFLRITTRSRVVFSLYDPRSPLNSSPSTKNCVSETQSTGLISCMTVNPLDQVLEKRAVGSAGTRQAMGLQAEPPP